MRHVHGQRGLADAADAGDGRDGHALGRRLGRQEGAQANRDLLAAGEVADGGRELGGARQLQRRLLLLLLARRLLLLGDLRRGERGVGGQDALVQRGQFRARLDAPARR
ncbi:hypothetical protein GCM10020220_030560 [Nonomuraea rubra]